MASVMQKPGTKVNKPPVRTQRVRIILHACLHTLVKARKDVELNHIIPLASPSSLFSLALFI